MLHYSSGAVCVPFCSPGGVQRVPSQKTQEGNVHFYNQSVFWGCLRRFYLCTCILISESEYVWKTHSSVKYFISGGLFFIYHFVSEDLSTPGAVESSVEEIFRIDAPLSLLP